MALQTFKVALQICKSGCHDVLVQAHHQQCHTYGAREEAPLIPVVCLHKNKMHHVLQLSLENIIEIETKKIQKSLIPSVTSDSKGLSPMAAARMLSAKILIKKYLFKKKLIYFFKTKYSFLK
jgi:hypothetical protein